MVVGQSRPECRDARRLPQGAIHEPLRHAEDIAFPMGLARGRVSLVPSGANPAGMVRVGGPDASALHLMAGADPIDLQLLTSGSPA
jgi:hypothetical protein